MNISYVIVIMINFISNLDRLSIYSLIMIIFNDLFVCKLFSSFTQYAMSNNALHVTRMALNRL